MRAKFSLKSSLLIICVSFLIFLFACNKTEYVEQSLNEKLKFNSADYQNAIRELFVNNDSLFAQQDTLIENFDTLKYFYSKRDFKPLFIKSFEEKGLLYSFLITFKNAEEHGLNPEAYHYGWISEE
ncbi:MAG: hypothetical protein HKP17_14710, partial [Ignavibacteriaceae bacterium]|nr:hypothetical protein [Ignavibacteriaceae bacterium]